MIDIETVGTGLDVSGSPITGSGTIDIDLDLSELASATGAMGSSDNFVISSSGGTNRKSTPNLIGLSLFNNDAGFTTNSGTVTNVTVGTGLDVSSGTSTPNITVDLNELAAVDTSSNTIEKFIIVDDEGESASATPTDLQTVDTFFKNSQTIINANWSDDTNTTSYINIPLNYIIDSTSSQYYNHFACPTAGTVKYIMMMHVSGTFTGPFTTQLRVIKNGSAADTSGELTPSNASADGSYIEYAPNTSFAKGDRLRFAYSKSATGNYWRGTVASIIIEFENK